MSKQQEHREERKRKVAALYRRFDHVATEYRYLLMCIRSEAPEDYEALREDEAGWHPEPCYAPLPNFEVPA